MIYRMGIRADGTGNDSRRGAVAQSRERIRDEPFPVFVFLVSSYGGSQISCGQFSSACDRGVNSHEKHKEHEKGGPHGERRIRCQG